MIKKKYKSSINKIFPKEYDLLDVIPVPTGADKMVKMQTLQEAIEEFENDEINTISYLVRVKLKKRIKKLTKTSRKEESLKKSHLQKIYKRDGTINIEYLENNAQVLFNSKEYELSKNIYLTILNSGQKSCAALRGLGSCSKEMGDYLSAQNYFEEAIAYKPGFSCYKDLIEVLLLQGKNRYVGEVIERVLKIDKLSDEEKFDLHKTAGNAWMKAEFFDKSENHFKSALNANPFADDVQSNLGSLYLNFGKIDQAIRAFEDAIASNSKNENAHLGISICLYNNGDKKEAHKYLIKCLELNINNPTAVYYLIKTSYETQSFTKAVNLLEIYTKIDSCNINIIYSLAGMLFHLGKMRKSSDQCNKIIEMDPLHKGAKKLLNMIHNNNV